MGKATGKNSIAIGDAVASGEGSIAIGGGTNITGSGPTIIGNNNSVGQLQERRVFKQDYRDFCKEISNYIAQQAKQGIDVNSGSALTVREGMINKFMLDMKVKYDLSHEKYREHVDNLCNRFANPNQLRL